MNSDFAQTIGNRHQPDRIRHLSAGHRDNGYGLIAHTGNLYGIPGLDQTSVNGGTAICARNVN